MQINFHTSDGDIRSATKFQSALIGFSTGASEVLFTTPLNFVKFRMQRPEWGYTGVVRSSVCNRVIGASQFASRYTPSCHWPCACGQQRV